MVFKPVNLTAVGAGWGQSKFSKSVSSSDNVSILVNETQSIVSSLPSGFTYLDNVCKTIQTSVRYCSCENFLGCRVDGYHVRRIVLTQAAAEALAKVQAAVQKDGYSLVVYDGYRPQRAVDHFVRWSEDNTDVSKKMQYYPFVDKQNLFDLGYIAKRSGHSRGSTVDLSLIRLGKQSLDTPVVSYRTFEMPLDDGQTITLPYLDDNTVDMGSSFDMLGEASHYDCSFIPSSCKVLREYLCLKMTEQGFEPYSQEWWHFTLNPEPFPDTYFDFEIL